MVDQTYRGPDQFPNLDQLAPVSGPVEDAPRPTIPELGQVGDDFQHFSDTIGQMANAASAYKGQQQGATDAMAGNVNPQRPYTVFGQAYNDTAKQTLKVQAEAAMTEQMGKAFAANPNDPSTLGDKLEEIHAGLANTPWADVNADLQGIYLTHRATFMTQAQLGLKDTMTQGQLAAFEQASMNGGNQLDTVAAGAPLNPQGWQAVTTQIGANLQNYARFGPKTAFSIGGVDFPDDQTRGGLVSPADIERRYLEDQQEAKTTWIYNSALRLPNSQNLADFITDVQHRYAGNDPMMQGLDGNHYDALERRLLQLQFHEQNRENTQLTRSGMQAEQLMGAWQWGGDVNPDDMIAAAKASGNPELLARAQFYAQTPQYARGILKTVVARQDGVIGPADPTQYLDAEGNPVNAVNPPAPQAQKPGAPNPAMANPQSALQGVLGPGFAITSAARTPQHNADVNGVTNSYHLTGHAVDFTPPAGISNATALQKLKASGMPFVEMLDEGNHVHVAWTGPSVGQVWSTPPNVKPGTPAFAAWANTKQGFATDPIDYARGNQSHPAIADVAPMDPSGFASQDPVAQANWAKALQQRQALGQTLSRNYATPLRMLTNGERDFYKSTIEQNPAMAVALGRAAQGAVGPDGARSFLRELGQDGSASAAALTLADLDGQGSHQIVQSALDGLQLKAEGAKAPGYNKTDPEAQLSFDTAQMKIAPAFQYAPEALNGMRRVAELARISDAAKGVDRTPDWYMQSAAGSQRGSDGAAYGGVMMVNGRFSYLPPWLAQTHVEDSLKALGTNWQAQGTGPRYANGQVIAPADAARMQLVYRPDGHYWLVDPRSRGVMRGQTGKPFELDFDGAKRFLQTSVPGAVMGGQ